MALACMSAAVNGGEEKKGAAAPQHSPQDHAAPNLGSVACADIKPFTRYERTWRGNS